MVYSCQICTNEYNMGENLPKILGKCGHTICKKCLSYQIMSLKSTNLTFQNWLLKCPFDNTTYLIKKRSSAEDFPKNFFLIDLIQNKLQKLQKKNSIMQEKKSLTKKEEILPPKTLKQRYEEDYGVKLDEEKLKNQEAFRNKQNKRKFKNNIKVFVSDKHIKFFNKNLNSIKQKIINKKVTQNFIEKTKNDLKNKKANFLKNKTNFDQLFQNLKKKQNKNKKSFNLKSKLSKTKNKSKVKINLLKNNKSRKNLDYTKKKYKPNVLLNFKKNKSKKFLKVDKNVRVLSKKNLLKKFNKHLNSLSRSKKKLRKEKIITKNTKKLNLLNKIKSQLGKNLSINKNDYEKKNQYKTEYEESLKNSIIIDYNQRQSNLSQNKMAKKVKNPKSDYSFNLIKNKPEKIITHSEFSLNLNKGEKNHFITPSEISVNLNQKNIYFNKKKLLFSQKNINLSVDKINSSRNNFSNTSNMYFERYSNYSQTEKIRYSQTPDLTTKKIVLKPSSDYFFDLTKKIKISDQKKEILKIKNKFTNFNLSRTGNKNYSKIYRSNLEQKIDPSQNFTDSKVLTSKRTSTSNVKNYNKSYIKKPFINFYLNN